MDPKLIIDAGANIGYSSIFFANRYPKARVIAVEPERSNYEMLVKNAGPYPHIVPIDAAVWPKKAHLETENPNAKKWSIRIQESSSVGSSPVESVTIEEIFQNYSENCSENIDILKLDVEGSEKDIFESSYKFWLDRTNIIIELHDRFTGIGHGFLQSDYSV